MLHKQKKCVKTWNGAYKKILESTGTGEWTNVDKQLCIVTGGGLSLGEFYSQRPMFFFDLDKKFRLHQLNNMHVTDEYII
jgi:hypothetical protein